MQEGKKCGFHPWVGKIPWSRKWHPTPVLLPGKLAEEPERLQSMGLQSRTQLSTSTSTEEWSINRFLYILKELTDFLHSQGIQLLFWLQGGHLEAEESSCRASWRHWYVNRTFSHPCGPLYLVTRVPARAETASLIPTNTHPFWTSFWLEWRMTFPYDDFYSGVLQGFFPLCWFSRRSLSLNTVPSFLSSIY